MSDVDHAAEGAIQEAGTIELNRPILVDGAERSAFAYDLGRITTAQFCAAEGAAKKASGFQATVYEMDYSFHLNLGFQAAIACDPSLDLSDLQRVAGPDLKKFVEVGRFFTGAAGGAEAPTSEEQPGSTQSDSQHL